MKRLMAFTIIILLTFPVSCKGMSSDSTDWFEPFTGEDWAYQLAYTAVTCVDWRQTQTFIKDPTKWERNPILGKYPSRTKVDIMIGSSIVVHGLISWALPPKPRRVWQFIWISIEADAVEHNYQGGVTISF